MDQALERVRNVVGRAERRIRLRRSLEAAAASLCVAVALASMNAICARWGLPACSRHKLMVALGCGVILATSVAWALPVERLAAARALDRFHGLHDRLSSALEFSRSPSPTPFMLAAIEDAGGRTPGLTASGAIPLRFPRALVGVALFAVLWGVVAALPPHKGSVAPTVKTIDAMVIAPDDLEDVRQFLAETAHRAADADTKAAIEQFNTLVDDLAKGRLDREEAFRRLQALDQTLGDVGPRSGESLDRRLNALGEELEKADLTRSAGAALSRHDLSTAREAMQDLAKKVRSSSGAIDKAKLDQIRAALKAASERAQREGDLLKARRQQVADEILRMKEKMGDAGSDEEQSLLRDKERELERLDRDLDRPGEQGRQLDRLDRDLDQAAEDLMRDLGLSASDLDQGAEDLNRMEQQQMTAQEKEDLRQQIQELRELMRQQGQGGKGHKVRLERFVRVAHGQGHGGGRGEGQQGQGTSQGDQGEQQEQGQGNGEGQGQGQGQGTQSGETWVVGPDGQKMLILTQGQRGQSQGQGGSDGSGGDGRSAPARWGEGHDPHVLGAGTRSDLTTANTQVSGVDTGQGPSRSRVIEGAAERGFASRDYRRVFTEYHQVAEESLAKDEIPGGYRFYVKRYFQLIRPREEP